MIISWEAGSAESSSNQRPYVCSVFKQIHWGMLMSQVKSQVHYIIPLFHYGSTVEFKINLPKLIKLGVPPWKNKCSDQLSLPENYFNTCSTCHILFKVPKTNALNCQLTFWSFFYMANLHTDISTLPDICKWDSTTCNQEWARVHTLVNGNVIQTCAQLTETSHLILSVHVYDMYIYDAYILM